MLAGRGEDMLGGLRCSHAELVDGKLEAKLQSHTELAAGAELRSCTRFWGGEGAELLRIINLMQK